jgi:hypothetical protein
LLLDRSLDAELSVNEALEICDRTGERWCIPEVYRMKGELALMHAPGNRGVDAAVKNFHQAIELARAQQAFAWEIKAAVDLARCLCRDRREREARVILSQTLAHAPEDHAGPELATAMALLDELDCPN